MYTGWQRAVMEDSMQQQSCPKCGTALVVRLDELECPACGYFRRKDAGSGTTSTASPVAQKIAAARRDQPLVTPPSRTGLAGSGSHLHAERLVSWSRIIFLFAAFAEVVAINLLAQHLSPDAEVTSAFVCSIVFVALVLAGLAALTLYIDWRNFKVFIAVCTVLVMIVYLVEFVLLWSGKQQLPLVRLIADLAVLSWFAFLNTRDIIKMQ